MKLDEALTTAGTYARVAKALADHPTERHDVPPAAMGFRGGELVLLASNTGRQDGAAMARMGAAVAQVFGPDVLALACETYTAASDRNPRTGRRWGQGEIQDAVAHHDALTRGWITEALIVVVANRAGDWGLRAQPYDHDDHGLIRWRRAAPPVYSWEPGATLEGPLIEATVQAMMRPTLATHAAAARGAPDPGEDLSRHEAQAMQDCATCRVLRTLGPYDLILPAVAGSERERIIGLAITEGLLPASVLTPMPDLTPAKDQSWTP